MTHEPTFTVPANGLMQRKLRLAGAFILAGLVVQGVSLLWNHPLSFFAFLGLGGLLTVIGIMVYLAALVSPRSSES
jgi:hypothetical protein